MNREDIKELYFITPIANVPSILQHGILSHKRAGRLAHYSVAMPEVQVRRKDKRIPGAGHLHDYANLYFDAHNPMLSACRVHNDEICILRVDAKVFDLPGVIISDRNAASGWARFSCVKDGLKRIDYERVFAQFWKHDDDPFDEMSHKSEKCAEILVPDFVQPTYIIGVFVANESAFKRFQKLQTKLAVVIKNDIFF